MWVLIHISQLPRGDFLVTAVSEIMDAPVLIDVGLVVNQDDEKQQLGEEVAHEALVVVGEVDEEVATDGQGLDPVEARGSDHPSVRIDILYAVSLILADGSPFAADFGAGG